MPPIECVSGTAGVAACTGGEQTGLEAAARGRRGPGGHGVHGQAVLWRRRDGLHRVGLRLPPLRRLLAGFEGTFRPSPFPFQQTKANDAPINPSVVLWLMP